MNVVLVTQPETFIVYFSCGFEPRQVELLVSEINLLKRAVRYLLSATWQTGTVKDRLGNTVEHLASKDPDLSLEAVLEIKTELKKNKRRVDIGLRFIKWRENTTLNDSDVAL